MGLFDSFRSAAAGAVNNAVSGAAGSIASAAQSRTEKFTFTTIPETPEQLAALPEADLSSPFRTTALTMLALLEYEKDPEKCFAMLNVLRGPDPMNEYGKSFLRDRIKGRAYIVRSFFDGATVQNGYTPSQPLTIGVSTNPHSFPDENWATMFINSAGADSPRQLKLRRKPSTNQWFLNDIQCLGDIREPADADPWA